MVDDAVGARIGGELRVEAHFGAGKDDAQRLVRIGGDGRRSRCGPGEERGDRAQYGETRVSVW